VKQKSNYVLPQDDIASNGYPHCDGRPILSIYEQLMSMKFAAEIAELSRDQIEGIFWRNAAAALGIGEDEGAANG